MTDLNPNSTIQIVDLIGLIDLSTMAWSECMFDEPRSSKNVPTSGIHYVNELTDLTKLEFSKPKLLLDRFCRAGRRGGIRFSV